VRPFTLAVIVLICWGANLAAQSPAGQERPTYRGGIDLVAMTAVVCDRSGRAVQGLSHADFELFDAGERRAIVEVSSERVAASVAILLDVSGSMEVGSKLARAKEAMGHLVSWLDSATDHVAVYTFDSSLREQRPFAPASPDLIRQLPPLDGFGSTSLYDAIAQIGPRLAAQGRSRRAIVVVTDGIDTSSRLSPSEAWQAASVTDVPVYVVAVVTAIDVPDQATRAPGATSAFADHPLEVLAHRTGGLLFITRAPAHASLAARQIAAELHHGYQIAFESGSQAGWHALTLRTRRKGLIVRARGGYVASSSSTANSSSK
jgi:Ca-activated chloride channel family protein